MFAQSCQIVEQSYHLLRKHFHSCLPHCNLRPELKTLSKLKPLTLLHDEYASFFRLL